jgi:glycogen debranching enzyme
MGNVILSGVDVIQVTSIECIYLNIKHSHESSGISNGIIIKSEKSYCFVDTGESIASRQIEVLMDQCRNLDESSNTTHMEYWVKVPEDRLDGFNYSMIKGKKSHFISCINGEVLPTDFRRTRNGFWNDGKGHISEFRVFMDCISAADLLRKYVRGLGYIYREYDSMERLDYVLADRGLLSIWYRADGLHSIEVKLKVDHRNAWPAVDEDRDMHISGNEKQFSVISTSGTTFFSVKSDGSVSCNLTDGYLIIVVKNFTLLHLTISSDDVPEGGNDLDQTVSYHLGIKDSLMIETGNKKLDKVFLWTKHDLLEFYTETGVGSGWFAGFPVFSWFFGRDGLWMGLAANMCGLGEITRKHMQTLLNHSRNGQIPHEIALNSGNQEYEVSRTSTDTRFMSIDSNLLWILCNRSLNHWGYGPFPDSVEDKVLGFSMSCDKDGDMLIENDFKKSLIGWPETWASQRDGKCVDINALWIAVLESLGSRLNGGYLQTAIDRYLEEFFEGPDFTDSIDSNSAHAVKSAMLLVPAMFLDDRRVKDQFSKLLGSDMITPWGVRSMSAEDKKYDGGYHTGMVWPLMTGWFSIAAYRQGFFGQGYDQIKTFIENAFHSADPGRINEAYSSDQPTPTGQFAQGWSSSMFIMSLLGGLAGMPLLGGDGNDIRSLLHPHLPEEMKEITLRHFNWHGEKFTVVLSNHNISEEKES